MKTAAHSANGTNDASQLLTFLIIMMMIIANNISIIGSAKGYFSDTSALTRDRCADISSAARERAVISHANLPVRKFRCSSEQIRYCGSSHSMASHTGVSRIADSGASSEVSPKYSHCRGSRNIIAPSVTNIAIKKERRCMIER